MTKAEKYQSLIQQTQALYDPELGWHTNLSQVAALLKYELDLYWAGFYLRKGEGLVLGPFQGEVACTKITIGKGVCGIAVAKGETVIVPDVTQFPGYIACHPAPKSEIVVPGFSNGEVAFVLDLDSAEEAFFNGEDQEHLEKLVRVVEKWPI